MKTIINFIKAICNAILNIFHKQTKEINKSQNVDNYERELDNMKENHKKLIQDMIELDTQEETTKVEIVKYEEELEELLQQLRKAKENKDSETFTYIALEHKAKLKNIKALKKLLESIAKSKEELKTIISNIKLNIKKQDIKLKELKFKKKITSVISSTNNIVETIDTDNPISNFNELESEIEEDFIRETVKTKINKTNIKPETFTSEEEMETYLKNFDSK
jgi:phage shock protein A